MTDDRQTDPKKTPPPDHRDNPNESIGVGDAVPDRRGEPRGDRDSPLNDDLAPPGTDPEGEQMPD